MNKKYKNTLRILLFGLAIFAFTYGVSVVFQSAYLAYSGKKTSVYTSEKEVSEEECQKHGYIYAINKYNFIKYEIKRTDGFNRKKFIREIVRDTLSYQFMNKDYDDD